MSSVSGVKTILVNGEMIKARPVDRRQSVVGAPPGGQGIRVSRR